MGFKGLVTQDRIGAQRCLGSPLTERMAFITFLLSLPTCHTSCLCSVAEIAFAFDLSVHGVCISVVLAFACVRVGRMRKVPGPLRLILLIRFRSRR